MQFHAKLPHVCHFYLPPTSQYKVRGQYCSVYSRGPEIAILQKLKFPYRVFHALEKISDSAKREASSRFSVDPSLCLHMKSSLCFQFDSCHSLESFADGS